MPDSETPHLLAVEDNPDTRLLLKHLLGGDYRLKFATTAKEALQALKSIRSFDLLLVDISLGSEASGTDLVREIKEREEFGDVPAIAVTAYAMPGDREELLNNGFDAYVGKPFTKEELGRAIDQTLAARTSREG